MRARHGSTSQSRRLAGLVDVGLGDHRFGWMTCVAKTPLFNSSEIVIELSIERSRQVVVFPALREAIETLLRKHSAKVGKGRVEERMTSNVGNRL
jgi:hypothetical protein